MNLPSHSAGGLEQWIRSSSYTTPVTANKNGPLDENALSPPYGVLIQAPQPCHQPPSRTRVMTNLKELGIFNMRYNRPKWAQIQRTVSGKAPERWSSIFTLDQPGALDGLSVEQLRALSGQNQGQPPQQKAKGQKKKAKKAKQVAPGQGKSKYAIARRLKALEKKKALEEEK
ncbi:hypothetical protein HJFPF1_03208 [Paramyrothecium foliicola]|nr:hypothetical protein HJFPF1_03208 [Paramyrothecium foliicola]